MKQKMAVGWIIPIIILVFLIVVVLIIAGNYFDNDAWNYTENNSGKEDYNNIEGYGVYSNDAYNESGNTYIVNITRNAFVPYILNVSEGDIVIWRNIYDFDHTVTSSDKKLNSGVILSEESYTYTFYDSGKYVYHCEIHPSMQGTINVQDQQ